MLGSSLDWDRACFTMDPVSVSAPLKHRDHVVRIRCSSCRLCSENVLRRPRGLHSDARWGSDLQEQEAGQLVLQTELSHLRHRGRFLFFSSFFWIDFHSAWTTARWSDAWKHWLLWFFKSVLGLFIAESNYYILLYFCYYWALCWRNTDFSNKIFHKSSTVAPEATLLTKWAWLCCPAVDICAYISLSFPIFPLGVYFWEKAFHFFFFFKEKIGIRIAKCFLTTVFSAL